MINQASTYLIPNQWNKLFKNCLEFHILVSSKKHYVISINGLYHCGLKWVGRQILLLIKLMNLKETWSSTSNYQVNRKQSWKTAWKRTLDPLLFSVNYGNKPNLQCKIVEEYRLTSKSLLGPVWLRFCLYRNTVFQFKSGILHCEQNLPIAACHPDWHSSLYIVP